MLKNLAIIAIAFITAFTACKGESDILVSYEGGNISRGEFHDWIKSRNLSEKSILSKKSNQTSKLKQYAADKITFIEAEKSGFTKSEELKGLMDLVRNNFLAGYFVKKIRDSIEFKEDALKLSIIKLTVKNFKVENKKRTSLGKEDIEKESKQTMDKAKDIISELDKKGNFSELAKKHSDDFSRKNGGDLGYMVHGMREPEVLKAGMDLKPGEYTKEPVKVMNSIYIIKLEDKKVLTDKNISSIIPEEKKAEGLKRRLQINAAKSLEESLVKAADVKDMIDTSAYNNPEEVLFQAGSRVFKVSDFNSLLDFSKKRRESTGREMKDPDVTRKKQIVKRLFRQELLVREAIKRGLDKSPGYIKDWEFIRQYTIAGEYKNSISSDGINVTDKEIKLEYDKNKNRSYSKKEKKGAKMISKVLPFSEVKDRIRLSLISKKRSIKRSTWEQNLLKKYNMKVDTSKLTGTDK